MISVYFTRSKFPELNNENLEIYKFFVVFTIFLTPNTAQEVEPFAQNYFFVGVLYLLATDLPDGH